MGHINVNLIIFVGLWPNGTNAAQVPEESGQLTGGGEGRIGVGRGAGVLTERIGRTAK